MPAWNLDLFLLLNAPGHPSAGLVGAAAAVTDSPAAVAPLLLVSLWVWGVPDRRGALLAVTSAILLAQGANQLLGLRWFDPRPFMVPVGHTLLAHAADNGFPSDHATLVWALGAGLVLTGAAPRWGAAVCLYGVPVAWSRIWLGIHFPADMLASAMVAVLPGYLARAARAGIDVTVMPWAACAYERAITALRLPPGLVPRRPTPHG